MADTPARCAGSEVHPALDDTRPALPFRRAVYGQIRLKVGPPTWESRKVLLHGVGYDEVVSSVFGPGRFVMPGLQRPLFAVADRLDPFLLDTQVDKVFGRFIGALLAERHVVFHGAPLVTVSFDDELVLRLSSRNLVFAGMTDNEDRISVFW